jgi:hypothetical protein
VSTTKTSEQTRPERPERSEAARVAEGLQLAGAAREEAGGTLPARPGRGQLRRQAGQRR